MTRRPVSSPGSRAARETDWECLLTVGKAALVVGGVFYTVWWIHIHEVSRRITDAPLSLAISFLCVQFGIIAVQLIASVVIKNLRAAKVRGSRKWRPVIDEHLSALLAGEDRIRQLRRLRRTRPEDLEERLVETLRAVSGEQGRSLSHLAVELGLVRRWEKLAARGVRQREQALEFLSTLSPEAGGQALRRLAATPPGQAAACRVLIPVAEPGELSDLFLAILRAPPLVRAMVARDLCAHAESLAAGVIPEVLSRGEEAEVMAALDMVHGWNRVLRLPAVVKLMAHSNPEIRSRALRLAPLIAVRRETAPSILDAMGDSDTRVQLAALASAARMRLDGAAKAVEACAHSPDDQISRMACLVLGSLGPEGHTVLESKILTADRRVAAWAAESLARVRIGREPNREF